MNNSELIKELMEADATLNADEYKSWCQVRLAISSAIKELQQNNGKPLVSGSLSEEECKCIRFVGGTKWYSNGCKVHPDNDR